MFFIYNDVGTWFKPKEKLKDILLKLSISDWESEYSKSTAIIETDMSRMNVSK